MYILSLTILSFYSFGQILASNKKICKIAYSKTLYLDGERKLCKIIQ